MVLKGASVLQTSGHTLCALRLQNLDVKWNLFWCSSTGNRLVTKGGEVLDQSEGLVWLRLARGHCCSQALDVVRLVEDSTLDRVSARALMTTRSCSTLARASTSPALLLLCLMWSLLLRI